MNKQTEALKMAIEALDDLELCDYATAQKAIQACKEALEQPAQEYLTRAQQVIRANNSAQEHCVNLKMDKCEHKNICEHCTHPAPQPAQEPVAWNEEEFNAIAYAYRSCPAHEVKMISERYQELVNYVLSIANPAPSCSCKDKK